VQSVGSKRKGGAIVAFTSANPGEGVSHVVQFFAEKLASLTGKSILVVNAERLPSLQITDLMNLPGLPKKVGNHLSISGEASATSGNGNGNGNGNGAGKLPHPERQPLESQTGLDLLRALGANFDYALIDCPSISTSPEAAMVAPDVDGVVLVVEADRTKRDQIFRARQTIEVAQGRLMGLVLNRRRHVVPDWFYKRL
jgi:Mrp family chromosome partitioning ATPase